MNSIQANSLICGDSLSIRQWLPLMAAHCHSSVQMLLVLLVTFARNLPVFQASRPGLFDVIPPSLLSIYLFNLKQTKLFALIKA